MKKETVRMRVLRRQNLFKIAHAQSLARRGDIDGAFAILNRIGDDVLKSLRRVLNAPKGSLRNPHRKPMKIKPPHRIAEFPPCPWRTLFAVLFILAVALLLFCLSACEK